MFKQWALVGSLGLAALCAGSVVWSQQADKPAFVGPPPAEELKVLAPLVGQWTSQTQGKPSAQRPQGVSAKGEVSTEWIHNGHFLKSEVRVTSDLGRHEFTEITSFDRRSGKLRRYLFSSEGFAAQSLGEWDENSKTLTWEGIDLPQGWAATSTTKVGKDRYEFTLLVKNAQGETLRDATGSAERKKAAGK
jgi:hypothetical protein